MTKENLNNLTIDPDGESVPLTDESVADDRVEVVFRRLDERLIQLINEHEYLFGCVAWLTHPQILDAMVGKSVAVVVQKEDFLRPDSRGDRQSWKADLRRRYQRLACELQRFEFNGRLRNMSFASGEFDAVRCVGNHNRDKEPAFPRAHHKFVVFGKRVDPAKIVEHSNQLFADESRTVLLTAVWTGSFNFTKNWVFVLRERRHPAPAANCPSLLQRISANRRAQRVSRLAERLVRARVEGRNVNLHESSRPLFPEFRGRYPKAPSLGANPHCQRAEPTPGSRDGLTSKHW